MAEDAIDYALEGGRLPQSVKACQTHDLPLIGAIGYHSALFTEIAQNYVVPHRPGAIDTHVAQHLTRAPCASSLCVFLTAKTVPSVCVRFLQSMFLGLLILCTYVGETLC
jgi:hypothetical protein